MSKKFAQRQRQYIVREIFPKRLKLVVREWTTEDGGTNKSYRARVRDPNRDKYAYFTLKSETETSAIEEAIDVFQSMSNALEQKLPIGRDAKKIDHYIDMFISHMETRAKNGHITFKRVTIARSLLRSLEYFSESNKNPSITDLPLLYQDKWELWRDKSLTRLGRTPLTPSSRNNEMNCHKQFFRFLLERHIVGMVPKTNNIKKIPTVIPFPRDKYKSLLAVIRKDIDNPKNPNVRKQWDKMLMRHIIMLMYGTGCRVVEVKNLRWKDVYIDEDKNPRIHFHGKKKERDIVVHNNVYSALNDWKTYVIKKGDRFGWNETDYPFVFSAWNQKHVSGQLNSTSRRNWYKEIDLDPIKYQLGCFRHQFISHRLKKGRQALHIAYYCGTSVKMIQQTYGSITPPNLFEQVFSVVPEQSLESNPRSKWFEKLLEE